MGGRVARKRGLLEPCVARGPAAPVAGISKGDLGQRLVVPLAGRVCGSSASTGYRKLINATMMGRNLRAGICGLGFWVSKLLDRLVEFSVHEIRDVIHLTHSVSDRIS